ncbi:MAG: GNAT family N-acetyltransferase [Moraxellaceae bacterium]|nr:GNAT family N-acetyltransferase [Moraxellaceae bacterium]
MRRARSDDVLALVGFFQAHAEYEGARIDTAGLAERLEKAIETGEWPWIVVAEEGGIPVGYASFNREFNTWRMAPYLHMDCLYLQPDARGRGVGQELVSAGVLLARQLGLEHMEWHTPVSNEGAIRFYQRLGAEALEKVRFKWRIQERS